MDQRSVAALIAVQAIVDVAEDASGAADVAAFLTGPECVVAPPLIAEAVESLLAEVVGVAAARGWTPYDLAQIVGRHLGARHLPVLSATLTAETDRYPRGRVASQWRAEIVGIGPARAMDLTAAEDLALALGLGALLGGLPLVATVLPPPGARDSSRWAPSRTDSKQLARVRALLAKAESTEFDDEAELLSAKAQQLISQYALDTLLDAPDHADQPASAGTVAVRRLWIDPPYVLAKGVLIDEVAAANRCSTVISEQLGFSTVIGAQSDLDAVELLATSLLAQAETALRRSGRHTDRRGISRTTSFRRSFLLAYASRIGERLRSATADAVEQVGRSGALVPLLRRRRQEVDDLRDGLFPQSVQRSATVSNSHGWMVGRAAADLALFDADQRPITDSA